MAELATKTKSTKPPWTAFTLFSIVFGEIASGIKKGKGSFRNLETITLGYEPDEPGRPSTLIRDHHGNWFRLTVEAVQPPSKLWWNGSLQRWLPREEPKD